MSAIKLGNSDITLKVGDTSVSAAYLGSTLVYSGGTPPIPTGYTYSVTIQGLENGDTTTIWWDATRDIHTDSNVGNGTYTYTTTTDDIAVSLDTSGLSDYTVDYNSFMLYSGGSQTVTFTHQGGGGGLVQIPYGTDMSQYYNRYIKRIVIGDGTLVGKQCYINNWGQSSYISIASWGVSGFGEFSGITSLPIDSTPSNPVQLELWEYTDSNWSTTNTNPFNDLQIEWA